HAVGRVSPGAAYHGTGTRRGSRPRARLGQRRCAAERRGARMEPLMPPMSMPPMQPNLHSSPFVQEHAPWREARRLLIVRADNIGDIVMAGPALRALREALPSARLTLLASPAGAEAAALLPWLDDVIAWRVLWQDLG